MGEKYSFSLTTFRYPCGFLFYQCHFSRKTAKICWCPTVLQESIGLVEINFVRPKNRKFFVHELMKTNKCG